MHHHSVNNPFATWPHLKDDEKSNNSFLTVEVPSESESELESESSSSISFFSAVSSAAIGAVESAITFN